MKKDKKMKSGRIETEILFLPQEKKIVVYSLNRRRFTTDDNRPKHYHQQLNFSVCKNIQYPSSMIIIFAHEDFNGLSREYLQKPFG